MIPLPTFDVSINPAHMQIATNSEATASLAVRGLHGFNQPVTISLTALPTGIATSIADNPLLPGEQTQLTVTVDGQVPPGDYGGVLIGATDTLTRSAPITITVTAETHRHYLPLVDR
jgi:hypothetical protein